MRCSHNAKIWLAYVKSVDNVLSTFEIRVTSCRNVLEPEQIEVVPELRKPWCSCDSANKLGKIQIYPPFCLVKLSASNPTASVLVISPLNSIVQVSEYKFTELGLSAVHLEDWTGLLLETGLHLKLSAAIGIHFTAVRWSPTSNT